jgi:hypothetical protein
MGIRLDGFGGTGSARNPEFFEAVTIRSVDDGVDEDGVRDGDTLDGTPGAVACGLRAVVTSGDGWGDKGCISALGSGLTAGEWR